MAKTTTEDLVSDLELRNTQNQYDEIIQLAKAGYYHEFKAPDDATAPPKLLLVQHLAAYPELHDIMQKVKEGEYDE